MGKSWGNPLEMPLGQQFHGEIMGDPWGMPLGRRFHGEIMEKSRGNQWEIHAPRNFVIVFLLFFDQKVKK
jgi:hypothetical protein